jgi:hypothetical protein
MLVGSELAMAAQVSVCVCVCVCVCVLITLINVSLCASLNSCFLVGGEQLSSKDIDAITGGPMFVGFLIG